MSEKVLKDGRLKIRLDCTCGSAVESVGSDHSYVREMTDWFTEEHSGKEGHGLCSVAEGGKARRREQRQRMTEWRRERKRERAGG